LVDFISPAHGTKASQDCTTIAVAFGKVSEQQTSSGRQLLGRQASQSIKVLLSNELCDQMNGSIEVTFVSDNRIYVAATNHQQRGILSHAKGGRDLCIGPQRLAKSELAFIPAGEQAPKRCAMKMGLCRQAKPCGMNITNLTKQAVKLVNLAVWAV
jgi:hypothetical protein